MKQAKLLNAQEFKRLAAVIDSKRHAVRNHTVVALSFYAGLRACEIAGLRVGDVYEANRMRRLRPIDFARFRWVTRLRKGHRLQMEVLHGGWWGWVYRAV